MNAFSVVSASLLGLSSLGAQEVKKIEVKKAEVPVGVLKAEMQGKKKPAAQGKGAAQGGSDAAKAQDKGPTEAVKVDPMAQLKTRLELAKKEAEYLRNVKKGGGLLGRFKRSRQTARGLIQAYTPKAVRPVVPAKKFVARLFGDGEKANLGADVVFTVHKIPVTKKEFDATVEFVSGYPRSDSTMDVKTAAIRMLVASKGWQGIYGSQARAAFEAIQSVKAELTKGASFSDLAMKHSDDKNTAADGGKRDYIVKKTADKNYARVAFSLKVGEVSDVFATAEGFHIVRLLAKKKGESEEADQALTSHIVKRFSNSPDQQTAYDQLLKLGRIDVAFRSDELRKFAPPSFN